MTALIILLVGFFALIAILSFGFSRLLVVLSKREAEHLQNLDPRDWPKKILYADTHTYKPLFMTIGLVLSLGLTLILFEWKSYDETELLELADAKDTFEEVYEIPPTQQPPPPKPKIQHPEIVAVPDEEEIEQEIELVLDVEVTEETRVEDIQELDIEEPAEEVDEIFLVVEEQPAPVGGMTAFYKFLGDHIQYPETARRVGISGRVFVEFVVDKTGHITMARVVKGIGGGCDEEAVRVVKLAPPWKPGMQRGRPVRVKMTVPVYFKLE